MLLYHKAVFLPKDIFYFVSVSARYHSPSFSFRTPMKREQLEDDPPPVQSVPNQDLPSTARQQSAGLSKCDLDLDITRKVEKILNEVISPESSTVDCTQVGRQSRLMHADMNTVVSHGISGKKAMKKKKVKPTLITVKPYEEDQDQNRPTTPHTPELNVCKHGIPIVDSLDNEDGGCIKCQRPNSRGGRELQEFLKFKRTERKKSRKFWAKNTEIFERTSRRQSQDSVEKALREFEEFHDKQNLE